MAELAESSGDGANPDAILACLGGGDDGGQARWQRGLHGIHGGRGLGQRGSACLAGGGKAGMAVPVCRPSPAPLPVIALATRYSTSFWGTRRVDDANRVAGLWRVRKQSGLLYTIGRLKLNVEMRTQALEAALDVQSELGHAGASTCQVALVWRAGNAAHHSHSTHKNTDSQA